MTRERICDYPGTEGLFANICTKQDEIDFYGKVFSGIILDPYVNLP